MENLISKKSKFMLTVRLEFYHLDFEVVAVVLPHQQFPSKRLGPGLGH